MQGIASLLANRNLVLVTAENEILDILTPQQQEKLQNRILEEIATYWRSWQSPQLGDETKLLPEIDRLLNKLISGKKEITPALPESTETENKNQYQSLPIISRGLPLLDAAIAQIESHAIAIASISRTSGQLLQAVQTQLNIFLYGKQQQLTTKQTGLDADWEDQISKIQALIWGAVHYFFGERKTKKLKPKTPKNIGSNQKSKIAKLPKRHSSPALPKSPDLTNHNIEDPWLTMDDLFGDMQEVTQVVHEQQLFVTTSESTKSALPPSPFLRKTRQINSISPLAQRAQRAQIRDAEASTPTSLKIQNSKYVFRVRYTLVQPLRKKHKSWKFSLSPDSVSSKSSSKSESETNKGEILRQQQNTTQIEAKPDWIETQAHTIGYDKHLLEQILESLDRVMLWLEDIFVKIGLFLRRLSRRK
ncbi:hypothetical protein DP117_28775 [Brasilonema sp. UFV-L1]|nr:hypothetical protein [Brasilonema sp. UFV-L1]